MKRLTTQPRLVLAFVAAATLAGCGEAQIPGTTLGRPALSAHDRVQARSWMLPEAEHGDLLYVANVYTITVYSYPKGKLVGTLSDFYQPFGECVDAQGDVWITESKFQKIYEYPRGGTKPIHTLQDPNEQPYGCAVDPTTGNLAVANYSDASGFQGNVVVYQKAKGAPRSYTGYDLYYYYYLGYDPKGNLFVDGQSNGNSFEFGELRKGSGSIAQILLPKAIVGPGGVQWDGQYLAVGDMTDAVIYEFSFSKNYATLEGTTPLSGAGLSVGQFGIAGSSVVTPNQFFSGSGVLIYPYPAGGSPTMSITNGVFYPFSAVISSAPSH
jgi:hypothetical protein